MIIYLLLDWISGQENEYKLHLMLTKNFFFSSRFRDFYQTYLKEKEMTSYLSLFHVI